jgi:hypothetical protein
MRDCDPGGLEGSYENPGRQDDADDRQDKADSGGKPVALKQR